jgi:hypothetical protein
MNVPMNLRPERTLNILLLPKCSIFNAQFSMLNEPLRNRVLAGTENDEQGTGNAEPELSYGANLQP